MAGDFEVREPEETLYKAARLWEHAGGEWDAAEAVLPDGFLSGWMLGPEVAPESEDFTKAYHACLCEIRERLAAGAQVLHGAARALARSAEEYVQVDNDLDSRVDGLVERLIGPDQRS